MPGEFLPPVITKLEGNLDHLEATVEEAKALIKSIGDVSPHIAIKIDKKAIDRAIADADVKKGLADVGKLVGDVGRDAEQSSKGIVGLGADLGSLSNYAIPALIGGAVALSPVILSLGFGLAGFGAAAFGAVGPIVKAAQATGGLRANMHTLNPEQRSLAAGVLSLGKEYDQFQKSLQPEVVTSFGTALHVAGNIMHDVQPVAAATGKAFNGFLANFGATLQDSQWKPFWSFLGATAPKDMALLSAAFDSWLNAIPKIAEGMQPVAEGLLRITTFAGEAAGKLGELAQKATHPNSNSILGELDKLHPRSNSILGELDHWIGSIGNDSQAATPKVAALSGGLNEQASAASRLAAALSGTLGPLNSVIGDMTSFHSDNDALVKALQASHGQVDDLTTANRAAASAMVTSANDAMQLSQAIKANGGSAAAQIRPLEALREILERNGATGSFARQEVQALSRAIASLHSKTVNVTVHGQLTGSAAAILSAQGIPNTTLYHVRQGGYAEGTKGAAPGWALVGERGPELMHFRGGETVIPNHALRGYANGTGGGQVEVHAHFHMDGEEVFHHVQKHTWDYNVANGNRETGGKLAGTMVPR